MSETAGSATVAPQADDLLLLGLRSITQGGSPLGEVVNYASQLAMSGRRPEAVELYRVWIGLNRQHPQVHLVQYNCACLMTDMGMLSEAAQQLTEVLAKDPAFMPAHVNLGGVMERMGNVDGAVQQWQRGLTYVADITGQNLGYKITALKQLSRVLMDFNRPELAENAMRECLQLNIDQLDVGSQYLGLRLGQCKWPMLDPWEGATRKQLISLAQPLTMANFSDDPLMQLGHATQYVRRWVNEQVATPFDDRRDAPIDPSRRLKIGYVSSDLRDHAIGYLMSEFFELHDKQKVEVFAYYCGTPSESDLTKRIQNSIEHWRDIRTMNDDEAARLIAGDGIDILVDVNGHTKDCRTGVFARRPAPIQVNWLGFPGTMGSPYHHYIIADDWIVPPGSEKYYTEKVVRLPCYQPNDRKREVADERPTRAQLGLPEDAFVYCCFNGAQKISRHTFTRWMDILKQVPNSVLWLLDCGADTNANIKAHAAAFGVDPERVIFAPKIKNNFHLARYPAADLFLDTSPYGAHTTASDALWMAVPVLTLNGRGFATRVCGSLLNAAGLPEMVVETSEAYVARAVALASDPATLAEYRARLEANRMTCDLFNMDKLVRSIETLYDEMAADYRREGAAPQPDLTNLDIYADVGHEFDHDAFEMQVHPDYEGYYRAGLAARDRMRPLSPDSRLWPGPVATLGGESEADSKSRAKARRTQAA